MSTLTDNPARYGAVSQVLHWVFAALIIATFISGEIFIDAPREEKVALLNVHASIAIVLMGLFAMRVLWRFSQNTPDEVNESKALVLAHKTVVLLLYIVPLALAVTGVLTVLSKGFSVPFLGHELIAGWATPDEGLNELFGTIHGVLVKVVVVAFLIHMGAALWHQFVKRDGTLSRMLPGALKAD